jgi:hypothetical protein
VALGDAWRLFKTVERLIEFEAKQSQALEAVKAGLLDLERRVTRLESREDLVVSEARSAARAGAADAMQGVILRIGERLGALEAGDVKQVRRATAVRRRKEPDPK